MTHSMILDRLHSIRETLSGSLCEVQAMVITSIWPLPHPISEKTESSILIKALRTLTQMTSKTIPSKEWYITWSTAETSRSLSPKLEERSSLRTLIQETSKMVNTWAETHRIEWRQTGDSLTNTRNNLLKKLNWMLSAAARGMWSIRKCSALPKNSNQANSSPWIRMSTYYLLSGRTLIKSSPVLQLITWRPSAKWSRTSSTGLAQWSHSSSALLDCRLVDQSFICAS